MEKNDYLSLCAHVCNDEELNSLYKEGKMQEILNILELEDRYYESDTYYYEGENMLNFQDSNEKEIFYDNFYGLTISLSEKGENIFKLYRYGYFTHGYISEINWDDIDEDNLFEPFPFMEAETAEECAAQPYALTGRGMDILYRFYDDFNCGYDLCTGRASGLAREYSPIEFFEYITGNSDYSFKVNS